MADPTVIQVVAQPNYFVPIVGALIGTFSGALLAFLSSRIQEGMKRHREKLVAANLALITLANLYREFLHFRKGFREDFARPGLIGDEPLWVLHRPVIQKFSGTEVDFKSIGFLLETRENVAVLDQVGHVQGVHRHLIELLNRRNEFGALAQERASEFHRNAKSDPPWEAITHAVGMEVTHAMELFAVELATRANENESIYLTGFSALRESLAKDLDNYFPYRLNKLVPWKGKERPYGLANISKAEDDYSYESLPPMPRQLIEALSRSL